MAYRSDTPEPAKAWQAEADYHLARASQEAQRIEQAESEPARIAHAALADHHKALAQLALDAAVMPEAESPTSSPLAITGQLMRKSFELP